MTKKQKYIIMRLNHISNGLIYNQFNYYIEKRKKYINKRKNDLTKKHNYIKIALNRIYKDFIIMIKLKPI